MVGHGHLSHVVVAGGELAGHVEEEAQRACVLVIDGEEVVVHGVARAASVEHPFPSVAGGDVVAESVGQVGLHVAIVPGHVHQRVARSPLGVGRVLPLAVVDVDGLLLAPGGGGVKSSSLVLPLPCWWFGCKSMSPSPVSSHATLKPKRSCHWFAVFFPKGFFPLRSCWIRACDTPNCCASDSCV